MPRPLRIDYDGAWHHAMNRGADHQATFLDDMDRRSFLFFLSEIEERFSVEVHAYCLMPNHYHLLLRSGQANLSRAMHRLDGLYTQRFNRRHGRDGALFRGRFRSKVIDSELYLARASAYIHANPVAASLMADVVDYRWSSLPAYVGAKRCPAWLRTDRVLELVGGRQRCLQLVVKEVESPAEDPRIVIEGDEAGVSDRVMECESTCVPTPADIDAAVANAFDVDAAALYESRRGERNVPRMVAMAIAHRCAGQTLSQLAAQYGLSSTSSVGSAFERLGKLLENDERLRERICRIEAGLKGQRQGV